MHSDSYQRLLNYALWLLGRKSYTQRELEDRLKRFIQRKKIEAGEMSSKKVMERLSDLGYVNDKKIVSDYLQYRLADRPVGKFLFIYEMKRRGISFNEADAAWGAWVAEQNINEKQLASEALQQQKKRFTKDLPQARRKKLAGFLARRGFSPDVIWSLLQEEQL